MQNAFLRNLKLWKKYAGALSKNAYLIYGGIENQTREEHIQVNSWTQLQKKKLL